MTRASIGIMIAASVVLWAQSAAAEKGILLFRKAPQKAAGALTELRTKYPLVKTAFMTLEAEALLAAGQTRRAQQRALMVIATDDKRTRRDLLG